jgi:non-ribosomal peptide synthetase component F
MKLLVEWNQTETAPPSDLCVHELFEAQVKRTPDAVAVEFGHEHLTYRELNDRSNQLAYFLQKLGIGPEVLVGLCVHRSLEMIVGLIAVLKAGGAYVPIDPTYPAARVAFMLDHVNARIVLTERNLVQTLPALKATRVICIDSPDWVVPIANGASLRRTATAANLVYVYYTSGSTGNPKGVMIPHRAVVNVLLWLQSAFPLDERDRVLQQISFGFDPSVLEILTPLLVGGRLVVAQPGGHQDPAYLVQTIIQRRITVLHLVPSMLRMLLQIPEL